MTHDTPLWLIFDVGTSGTKAALVTPDGDLLRTATHDYPTFSADGGVNEQNADDWREAVIALSRTFSEERSRIAAIVVTGQMQDAILIEEHGDTTERVILYSDTRAGAEAAEIEQKLGAERLTALTGNEQGADSLRAKLLWLSRHRPEALRRARKIVFGAADFVTFHLTGNAVTDTTTASTTGLFHLGERRWLEQSIFDEMGIGVCRSLMPMLVTGGAHVGPLTERAANALGLKVGLPVYHATGDAGAATIGAGSGEIGRAYGYLGTSGWVAFTSDAPGSPMNGVFTLAHPRPDRFIQIAPLLTAAGNLDWVRGLFPDDPIDALVSAACARPPSPVIYLPYLNGERTPFRDPLARAAFIGINGSTDRLDLVRAVLEGVAFGYRHALEALMPTAPESLILTGGGTRSAAWCQLFADVLNKRILLGSGAEHVGVRGAQITVQVASGKLGDYAPPGFPLIDQTLVPDAAQVARYETKYGVYRAAYPAMKGLFAGLAT
ncbi:MAG: FGGY family carbohydrate kinase [Anaerolineae bacterium]